jgi:hypothetical protein
MNPSIVQSRVNAKGAIIALEYEQAADELVGYENDLHETLAEISPAPSVIEVRYYQEFQREVGAAKKKYGGGVLTREATALANLWVGRGLNYDTMKAIAYDLFGITIPEQSFYQNTDIYFDHTFEPDVYTYHTVPNGRTTLAQWSETYATETFRYAWLRALVGESHVGTGKEFWLRFTPDALTIDNPEFYSYGVGCLEVSAHHPTGLTADDACFLSMSDEQAAVYGDITELEEGTPVVMHFTGITIPSTRVIELALAVDFEWNPDEDNKNEIKIRDDWEILWEEP